MFLAKGNWRWHTTSKESVSDPTFAQLIGRARSGNEEALVALYQRALPTIYRYVLARLWPSDQVEDVVADVFLVMVESIGDLRAEHEAGFYAWLIQIAHRKIAWVLQQRQRSLLHLMPLPESNYNEHEEAFSPPVELIETDLASDPAALHEWRETLHELGQALGDLSAEQQVVVVGRFLADQSIEELAQALNKQPGAIRALQFRALDKLAEHLGLKKRLKNKGKGGRV